MTGIYAIHNIVNDKYYIGQAQDINDRWIRHRSHLKNNNHENSHLQHAYNKYGKDNFEYLVIEECEIDALDEKEVMYIQKYNSYNDGYNQDLGGKGCRGYKHTEEEILKMRMIQNPKAVLQIDMNLNIVNRWYSASQAGKALNISTRGIKAVCERINRQKTLGGYYWVYEDEYLNNTVDWSYYLNINVSSPKQINQYDLDMNFIKTYVSAYAAEKETGFDNTQISAVCNYKRKTTFGYVWRFVNEYTEEQYQNDLNTDFHNKYDKTPKRIAQLDLSGNLVKEFESISKASKETGVSRYSIQDYLRGNVKSPKQYRWEYRD
jgi:group I intron endonuclease